jgi:hypothetical protein
LNVQNKIQDLGEVVSNLERKKKDIVDNTTLIKQDIHKAFEEIRLKLQKKEKEIIDRTEVYLQDNLQELNTFTRIINSKMITLNRIIDSINSNIIRRDEVTLLNFYAENHNKVAQSSETEIPDIPKLDILSNLEVCVNQDSIDTLLNNLNGITFEITSMKGVKLNQIPRMNKVKRDIYGNISHIINKKDFNTSYDFSRHNNLVSIP